MPNLPKPRYLPAGESALVVEFGDTIDPKIHDLVMALDAAIQRADIEGVTEMVPSYRSLMIHFDPRRLTTEALADALAGLDYASAPRGRGGNSGASPPATTRPTARISPKSGRVSICRESASSACISAHATVSICMVLRRDSCFSAGCRKNLKSRAAPRHGPRCRPDLADCRRPGAHRQLRHADWLVRDRPHASQDVRSPARPNFSCRHRRRALLRTNRSRRLRCHEHGGGSRRVLRTPRIFG